MKYIGLNLSRIKVLGPSSLKSQFCLLNQSVAVSLDCMYANLFIVSNSFFSTMNFTSQ